MKRQNEEKGEKMMESYSKLARLLLKARSREEGSRERKRSERLNKRQRLGSHGGESQEPEWIVSW